MTLAAGMSGAVLFLAAPLIAECALVGSIVIFPLCPSVFLRQLGHAAAGAPRRLRDSGAWPGGR